MGCACMKQRRRTRHDKTSVLASQTCFSKPEIEALHDLYKKVSSCLRNEDTISREDFQFCLFKDTRRRSLSADRVFRLFDLRNDGVIDFEEFVKSLNSFHPNAPQRDKATCTNFAFRLYDTRHTGFIEPGEVRDLIMDLLEESNLILTENAIDSIIDKTFEEADFKRDGRIDVEEWEVLVASNPSLLKNMTIPYLSMVVLIPCATAIFMHGI
ncbi:PREDICTED: calcineurin B-like protein 5 isoform X2 [Tarenaya hassleriana]|uniref:calcineurin B-like protein 5 isoform X2 n=1 Tax=Tarenaya hassleriana TaxID=28532 RepID=UPI00053C25AC|nr:PREDICTED: calcineurin B-like protein 5 isoform X2 [Tarenaya hassleriana]